MRASVILVYHPTRGGGHLEGLKNAIASLGIDVSLCQLGRDSLNEELIRLKAKGITHVIITPLLLSRGLHFERDVLEALQVGSCERWSHDDKTGLFIYVIGPLSENALASLPVLKPIIEALSCVEGIVDVELVKALSRPLRMGLPVLIDSPEPLLVMDSDRIVMTRNVGEFVRLCKWGIVVLLHRCDALCEAVRHAEVVLTTCRAGLNVKNVVHVRSLIEALLLLKRAFRESST